MELRFSIGTVLLATSFSIGYPISMDIGTFAVSWIDDLPYMRGAAEDFYYAAWQAIPSYTNLTAVPTHPMGLVAEAVTVEAVTSTSALPGHREYNDFLFFGGHGFGGSPPRLLLGDGNTVQPSQLSLGVGYTRFFLGNSCTLFNCPEGPQTCWNSAFKGLKAMIGYRSLMWDNPLSWSFFLEFWNNWTIREKSLLNSHFDAVSWLFARIQADPDAWGPPGWIPGYESGCLSAPVPAMTMDHCRLTFKYVAHDYVPGNPGTGYFYNRIIGSPIY